MVINSTLELGQKTLSGSWHGCNLLDGMPMLQFDVGNYDDMLQGVLKYTNNDVQENMLHASEVILRSILIMTYLSRAF